MQKDNVQKELIELDSFGRMTALLHITRESLYEAIALAADNWETEADKICGELKAGIETLQQPELDIFNSQPTNSEQLARFLHIHKHE